MGVSEILKSDEFLSQHTIEQHKKLPLQVRRGFCFHRRRKIHSHGQLRQNRRRSDDVR